jgi:hypothetical protein
MPDVPLLPRLWKAEPLCPECGAVLDAATPLEEAREPRPGNITFCAYCAEPLQFREDMSVERLPDTVVRGLSAEDQAQLKRMQMACWLSMLKRKLRSRG